MSVTFSIRKKLLSQKHYVFANLPDGRRKKIARFHSERDAENWVQFRASDWIAEHEKELGFEAGESAPEETAS